MLTELRRQMRANGYPRFKVNRLEDLLDRLQKSSIGTSNFTAKLLKSVGDAQQFHDIFVAGKFAAILADNGFRQVEIEYEPQGPDVRASYNGRTIYFEVTRRHSDEDEWGGFSPEPPEDELGKIRSKIFGKLSQLKEEEINVVVYWSSTSKVMSHRMAQAFAAEISRILEEDPEPWKELSGILFTEMLGTDIATLKQFCLFRNERAARPLAPRLATKLESLFDGGLRKKRELQELYEGVKSSLGPPSSGE